MRMLGFILLLLLILISAPLVFFLVLRSQIKQKTDRISQQLKQVSDRLASLEQKLGRTRQEEPPDQGKGRTEERAPQPQRAPRSESSKQEGNERQRRTERPQQAPPPSSKSSSEAERSSSAEESEKGSEQPPPSSEPEESKQPQRSEEKKGAQRAEEKAAPVEGQPKAASARREVESAGSTGEGGSKEEGSSEEGNAEAPKERSPSRPTEGEEQASPSEKQQAGAPSQQESEPVASTSSASASTPPPPGAPPPPSDPHGGGDNSGPTEENRSPGWERFIGENLINKIGIGILVLGIAFFVNYAIDQGWLGEAGRVAIGVLAGTALIAIAHRLRKRFKAFSSVLVGGGLAVLYFTITIAFQEYQLFSQTAAFVIMVIITVFAVLLSLFYDRQELAVISLLGGFATPFMVSTGEGSYIVLFSYLILLNLGMLSLAYQRRWTVVNVLAYVATVLIYGSWFLRHISEKPVALPFPDTLIFGAAFYLIFYLMSLAYKVRKGLAFAGLDFSILISVNGLFFAVGMSTLHFAMDGHYQGLFTVGMAAVNFAFSLRYYLWKVADRNLFFTLVGLTLTFVTLAAPIQLEGDHITLFWSAEAVLLLWLAQKSGISLLRLGSVTVTGLMLISLFMDWHEIYEPVIKGAEDELRILGNPGFITGLVSIASLAFSVRLFKDQGSGLLGGNAAKELGKVYTGVLIAMAYIVPLLELHAQVGLRIENEALRAILMGSYHFVAALIIFGLAANKGNTVLRILAFFGGVFLCLSFIFFYQFRIYELLEGFLKDPSFSVLAYLYHLVLVAALGLLLHRTWALLKGLESKKGEFRPFFRWFATFVGVFAASVELDQSILWIGAEQGMDLATLSERSAMIGYPLLWGLISFSLMWQGMKRKLLNLRIISLTLFGIILLKLFIIDIQDIPEVGRIIAFIALGILLLVVSFMYQKLKGILLEERPEEDR